ncbi:hypothetical protein, partial [Paraburkholderia bannensis]|uniref:hypothetical protein n=1 Tax=Paraburkholderia bannensis TaxID=765414 RepID=UPI002AB79434
AASPNAVTASSQVRPSSMICCTSLALPEYFDSSVKQAHAGKMGNFSSAWQHCEGPMRRRQCRMCHRQWLNVPSLIDKCALANGKLEFRAEFVLFTQVEGRISAASGVLYDPLPATPFGRKAMTGGALLAFASSKVGHCIRVHPNPGALAMAHSAIDDGTFGLRHGCR